MRREDRKDVMSDERRGEKGEAKQRTEKRYRKKRRMER